MGKRRCRIRSTFLSNTLCDFLIDEKISLLQTKLQDEAKALALCQTKVRQKKLPMEVIDAEYQW